MADRQGGPPYYWIASIDSARAGRWRASFARDAACGSAEARPRRTSWSHSAPSRRPARRAAPSGSPAASGATRTRTCTRPGSKHLFDAPPDEQPSWNALHEVLRDPSRNFLIDHLGLGEDAHSVVVRPRLRRSAVFHSAPTSPSSLDCLSAGLAVRAARTACPPPAHRFRDQQRPLPHHRLGGAPTPPRWADPGNAPTLSPWEDNVKRFGEFLRTTLADAAQSGAGRTPPDTDDSDYYPVALSVDTLRPGTIFADPYGHVLVVAEQLDQTPYVRARVLFRRRRPARRHRRAKALPGEATSLRRGPRARRRRLQAIPRP